jgi:hypothetical protein
MRSHTGVAPLHVELSEHAGIGESLPVPPSPSDVDVTHLSVESQTRPLGHVWSIEHGAPAAGTPL